MKAVIFDMDGLMFDTERVTCQSYIEVARAWGYDATEEQYLNVLGLHVDDICQKYYEYFGDDVDATGLFYAVGDHRFEIIDRDGLPVKKGLYDLMSYIEAQGWKMAVASSSEPAVIEKNLKLAGIEDRFAVILSGKDPSVKRGKPAPDLFLKTCELLEVEPEEALVLEDSNNGIAASIAGGIPVIGVPDLVPIHPELADQCKTVVEDLEQVIPILEHM